MGFNFVTNIESCYLAVQGNSSLLYYSHIPTALTAMFIGFFVFFRNRHNVASKLLLAVAIIFSLWSFFDLILWLTYDSQSIMFFWSIVNFTESLVSVSVLYLSYAFLEKKDLSLKYKVIAIILLLPFLTLIPTAYNLPGFNDAICESIQGPLIYYFYFLEGAFFLILLFYLVKKIIKTSGEERKKVLYFSFGALFFLLSFSGANIAGSVASIINPDNPDNWKILQYGLFGMPVFMGLLAYLIVRYQAFNIKLIATQALVVGLSVLIGAQLFFIKTQVNFILTSITFLLSIVFGILLIRSVKNEIQRKEELQMVTDKLAMANVELKRLDHSKTEFISIASHQLRTPLTAIKGFVSLLLEGSYGTVPPGIADILNKVYTANERIVHLVEDLLNISRMESGRLLYEYAEVEVSPLLNELRDTFAIAAQRKGLNLSFECPECPALPPIWIDRKKSFEVLSNIIDNALKYTLEGQVVVRAEKILDAVRISVTDTGMGIPEEAMPFLFLKFTRGEESGKMYASGTGLGLFVGKSMMEAQGGSISVSSPGVGKGATFSVDFPTKKK